MSVDLYKLKVGLIHIMNQVEAVIVPAHCFWLPELGWIANNLA